MKGRKEGTKEALPSLQSSSLTWSLKLASRAKIARFTKHPQQEKIMFSDEEIPTNAS
jgi:hypothetical protein